MTSTMTPTDSPEYVTVSVAARMLECHIETVRRWADAGAIHNWRTPGNQRRLLLADVQRLRNQPRENAA